MLNNKNIENNNNIVKSNDDTENKKIDIKLQSRRLSKVSEIVNLALCMHITLIYVISYVLVDITKVLATILNENFQNLDFVSDSDFWLYLVNICSFGVFNVLIFYIVLKKLKFNIKNLFNVEQIDYKDTFHFCIIAVGANFLTTIISSKALELVVDTSQIQFISADFSISDDSILGRLMYFIVVLITAPITEEFLFRGGVLYLLKPYGYKLAIFVSALIFSLIHGNVIQIPGTFVLGIILGYLTIKQKSIIPAIIVHFFSNLFNVMTTLLMYVGLINDFTLVLLNGFAIFASIYAVFALITFKKYNKIKDVTAFKGNFKYYFFSLPFVVLILIHTFRIFSTIIIFD